MPHIVITGASRRLGLYLTEQFLQRQWQVTALTRTPSAELTALHAQRLKVITLDYQSTSSCQLAAEQLQHQTIDVLLHNASFFEPDADSWQESRRQLDTMLNTHILLPSLLNQLFKPSLSRSDNPNIIHMSDIYVDNPNAVFSNYCASKAGLENLSKSYAKKYAPNIRVNTIQPGALKFLPEHGEAAKQAVLAGSLLPREAGFEPIFKTILYLVDNTFITGTAIKVDGGRSICR